MPGGLRHQMEALQDSDLYEFKAHRGQILDLPPTGKNGEERTVPA